MPPELAGLHPWFHASLLKDYTGPPIPPDAPSLEDAAGGESSGEFEVDRVLDKRISNGKVQYLISWRGFNQGSNSWEPVSNLQNCRRLVEEFERDRRQQRQGKRRIK